MYEIEMKAHVESCCRQRIIDILNKIAKYTGHVFKSDVYYHIPVKEKKCGYQSVRIRDENGKFYLTFKDKRLVKTLLEVNSVDEIGTEVNEEKECEICEPKVIESLLENLGGKIFLKKTKDSELWCVERNGMKVNIELCFIEFLGYFLELEILSEQNTPEVFEKARKLELELLEECGIERSKIENRYYSELLKQTTETKKNLNSESGKK